jgi:hypothetical protein
MGRLAAGAAAVGTDPSSNAVFGENWQAIRKSRRKMRLAARFFISRGVPAPSSLRRIKLKLNAPTWINCRFRMFSRPRRWQRRRPPVS